VVPIPWWNGVARLVKSINDFDVLKLAPLLSTAGRLIHILHSVGYRITYPSFLWDIGLLKLVGLVHMCLGVARLVN